MPRWPRYVVQTGIALLATRFLAVQYLDDAADPNALGGIFIAVLAALLVLDHLLTRTLARRRN